METTQVVEEVKQEPGSKPYDDDTIHDKLIIDEKDNISYIELIADLVQITQYILEGEDYSGFEIIVVERKMNSTKVRKVLDLLEIIKQELLDCECYNRVYRIVFTDVHPNEPKKSSK